MAYPHANGHDLSEMQKLSNEYEPEVKGPLVGQRQPSTAITTEYASADPVFQTKTAALPTKYAYYRTVRGDGKCGWRAVAFGYFEALLNTADTTVFLQEEARLRSLFKVVEQAGFDLSLFEDFSEDTFALLRSLATALDHGNAEAILLDSFNKDDVQNYVITHLRSLTAAWMKTHEAEYLPWMAGQTTHQYCESVLLPVGAEMENLGLSALKDVLLSPAGIALEVLYLDRSAGSEANLHHFGATSGSGCEIGTLRLLYRPGHYDILYKHEDILHRPSASVTAFLQYGSQHQSAFFDINVPNYLADLPGMTLMSNAYLGSMQAYPSATDIYSPATSSQTCPEAVHVSVSPIPQPASEPAKVFAPEPVTPPKVEASPTRLPYEIPLRTLSPGSYSAFQDQFSSGLFRPSAYQLKPSITQAPRTPCTTAIFRNSHFNTAHFMNPEFQPEQWDPTDEYAVYKNSRPKNVG